MPTTPCSLRTNPSGMVYCYTHDSATVPLRPTCDVLSTFSTHLFDVTDSDGRVVRFYEHPSLGDEAPAVAVHDDGRIVFDTEAWDLSTARLYCGLDA